MELALQMGNQATRPKATAEQTQTAKQENNAQEEAAWTNAQQFYAQSEVFASMAHVSPTPITLTEQFAQRIPT